MSAFLKRAAPPDPLPPGSMIARPANGKVHPPRRMMNFSPSRQLSPMTVQDMGNGSRVHMRASSWRLALPSCSRFNTIAGAGGGLLAQPNKRQPRPSPLRASGGNDHTGTPGRGFPRPQGLISLVLSAASPGSASPPPPPGQRQARLQRGRSPPARISLQVATPIGDRDKGYRWSPKTCRWFSQTEGAVSSSIHRARSIPTSPRGTM